MYCPYCAAALEANQTMCTRCGRVVGVAPAAVQLPIADSLVTSARPPGVKIGVVLLLLCWAITLLSFIAFFLAYSHAPSISSFAVMRSFGFSLLWLVLTVLLWQRQGWARIVVILLIAWSVYNLSYGLLRVGASTALLWSFLPPLIENLLRLLAVFLLFRPESNAWYSARR